jgi:molybdate transport system substrate-binding protein
VAGYGSSSQLRVQIEQGARADVYASADEEQMRPLRSAGLLAGDPIVIAKNRLVVLTSGRVEPALESLADLARPGLRLAAAEPSAPIGAYALQSLDAMSRSASFPANFRERVERNIVTREANVRQIVAKVEIGEVDAAIAYASDGVASRGLNVIEIPPELNVEARYTAAVLRSAPNPTLAQRFVDRLTSEEGQLLLERWGFIRAH